MDQLSVAEAELIMSGYSKRMKDQWARTQRIAYIVAQVNSKKKLNPETIVDLSLFDDPVWDDRIIGLDQETVPEDPEIARERARAKMTEYQKILDNDN